LELQPSDKATYGQFSGVSSDGCGFIDANLYFTKSLDVETLSDVKIEVNGKAAYWNNGYLGYRHCALNKANDLEKSWIQVGIVGAELTADENNVLKLTAGGDTYTQTFTSVIAAKSYSYSQVVADKTTKTVTATIIYNSNPGYKVGDELTGKCHDDHSNTATFKVTAVDGNTVTLTATDYVPSTSLLELKDANGVFTTATINTAYVTASDAQALSDDDTQAVINGATKQTLKDVTSTKTESGDSFSDASKLTNGVADGSGKLEGGFPSGGITITFSTESAVSATYLVLYTGNDDASFNDRAPQSFTLYGSTDGTNYTAIKTVATSGMQNKNYNPSAFALLNAGSYQYYKLVITSTMGASYFQMGELELYTGSVTLTGTVPKEGTYVGTIQAGVAYNGTAPAAETPSEGNGDGNGDGSESPKTGDIALAISTLALIATAGVVVCAKKRKNED
jgi:hypothetical protein